MKRLFTLLIVFCLTCLVSCGNSETEIIIENVLFKNKKISFPEWLKIASKEELNEVYRKMQAKFNKTGFKPAGMEQISQELGARGVKEWFAKHPPNLDLNFRWTDANKWDRD